MDQLPTCGAFWTKPLRISPTCNVTDVKVYTFRGHLGGFGVLPPSKTWEFSVEFNGIWWIIDVVLGWVAP